MLNQSRFLTYFTYFIKMGPAPTEGPTQMPTEVPFEFFLYILRELNPGTSESVRMTRAFPPVLS